MGVATLRSVYSTTSVAFCLCPGGSRHREDEIRDLPGIMGRILAALRTPQPNHLSILLQFGNELITLLDDIVVLPVLVVRALGGDNALDAVDGAR